MSNSATPWTVACHSPLSMGFSRQEYRSGLSFPPPGDLPNPGLKPGSPALAGRFFTVWVTREALYIILQLKKKERNQKKRDRAFGWDIIACEAEWRPWGSRRAFSCPRILLHHFHRTHKRVAAPESRVIHKGGGCVPPGGAQQGWGQNLCALFLHLNLLNATANSSVTWWDVGSLINFSPPSVFVNTESTEKLVREIIINN